MEFALAAGSEADVAVLKEMALELLEGSTIHADKGYTDYDHEDFLKEVGLHLKAQRKKRSKRPMPVWEEFLGKPVRQYIKTVFRELSRLFSGKIHTVTSQGFELKIVCFLLAPFTACKGQLGLSSGSGSATPRPSAPWPRPTRLSVPYLAGVGLQRTRFVSGSWRR